VYTYEGQIKLLQDRFAHLSFKTSPPKVLPQTLKDNSYENAQAIMWEMVNTYVDEYFSQNTISVDPEIQSMSADLQSHSQNKTAGSMTISNIADLKQMCAYVIFHAIFFHPWVHWNSYDDFTQILKFERGNPQAPSEKEAEKLEDQSNMYQTLIDLLPSTLKQWPVLDPELGGSPRLQELLLQIAPKINSAIQVGTLTMAPNT